jgi:hypothetical protein
MVAALPTAFGSADARIGREPPFRVSPRAQWHRFDVTELRQKAGNPCFDAGFEDQQGALFSAEPK